LSVEQIGEVVSIKCCDLKYFYKVNKSIEKGCRWVEEALLRSTLGYSSNSIAPVCSKLRREVSSEILDDNKKLMTENTAMAKAVKQLEVENEKLLSVQRQLNPRSIFQLRSTVLSQVALKLKKYMSDEISLREVEVDELKKRNRDLEEENDRLRSKVAKLTAKVMKAEPLITDLKHIIRDLKAEERGRSRELYSVEKNCEHLQRKLEAWKEDSVEKDLEYKKQRKLMYTYEREILCLKKLVEDSESDLEKCVQNFSSKLTVDKFVLKLMAGAMSVKAVERVMTELSEVVKDFPVYSATKLNNMRRDLSAICHVLNAYKLGVCEAIKEIGLDNSNSESKKGQFTTTAASALLKYPGVEGYSFELLEPCGIPRGKSAQAGAESFFNMFSHFQDIYGKFLDYCRASEVDVSSFPGTEDITLSKMKGLLMSDNAPDALARNVLIRQRIEEMTKGTFTEAQLEAMTDEDREAMCQIWCMGCIIHLRHLFVKEACKGETELLSQIYVYENSQFERLEKDVGSLIHAIMKCFHTDDYQFGAFESFNIFLKEKKGDEVLHRVGRVGTGSRFDAESEFAFNIACNQDLYEEFLAQSVVYGKYASKEDSEETLITKSIRKRLSTEEFKAPILARAMLFYACIQPMRVLMNSKDLEGFEIWDFGRMMDKLEEALLFLAEQPEALQDINFKFFSLQYFPCLRSFYNTRKSTGETAKQKRTVSGASKVHMYDIVGMPLSSLYSLASFPLARSPALL